MSRYKSCNDCLHYGACLENSEYVPTPCSHYQNKSDVVEVVRCKECKHCDFCYPVKNKGKEAREGHYCNLHKGWVSPSAYCSNGERKDDGT